ncbi:MAG: hypothetical protein EA379_00005 [Phycisphaerales bacterium]|nr:MAG: hypothetical protein EA379_00005 [Phycisphaerales bacterium]
MGVLGRVTGAFASFAPGSMPLMSRRSYRWELTSVCFLPMAVTCVEANVISVIAKKAFDASDFAIATLAAAPAMANITSVLWTRIIRGRDRVRVVNVMQVCTLLCVVAIAVAPFNDAGKLVMIASTLLARVFLTGIITARSDIWRANYPRAARARVTGKLTVVAALVVGLTALLIGASMDAAENDRADGFRVIYLGAAALGLFGVWAFSRVRWRGGPAVTRLERVPRADNRRALSGGASDMLRVLRDDRTYRDFMSAQFVLGLPNLAAIPIFVIALVDTFGRTYTESLLLTQVIPLALPILTIPLWARLLDRMHIVRFRVYHSWFFVFANLLMGVGLLSETMWVVYVSRVVLGVAYGGGMLAWNLGHHDFAKRDLATIYMGIHVTLTGVRGAVAPFLGAMLYAGFAFSAAGVGFSMPGLGSWTFIVCAAVSVVGALMFLRLHRRLGAAAHGAPKDA